MPFSSDVCGLTKIYMTCCGKVFCSGCVLAESQKMREGKLKPHCTFCREPIQVANKVHIDRTKKRMKAGDALAFGRLGSAYLNGEFGLAKDSKKAFKLFTEAAQVGSPEGYSILAGAYHTGELVEKDLAAAVYYCKLAAIGGHEHARHNWRDRGTAG